MQPYQVAMLRSFFQTEEGSLIPDPRHASGSAFKQIE